jgi:shikimate kinase
MPDDRPTRIFLVGMMGSGKTTVGRALERLTGWRYLDNDALVRDLTGRAPAEIRATDGEDALHNAEADALTTALDIAPPVIVGVAAAIVTDPAARAALRARGHVVWLRASPETLLERIGAGEGRRREATDPAWIRSRVREREALYADVADQVVDVDSLGPPEIAAAILEGLRA